MHRRRAARHVHVHRRRCGHPSSGAVAATAARGGPPKTPRETASSVVALSCSFTAGDRAAATSFLSVASSNTAGTSASARTAPSVMSLPAPQCAWNSAADGGRQGLAARRRRRTERRLEQLLLAERGVVGHGRQQAHCRQRVGREVTGLAERQIEEAAGETAQVLRARATVGARAGAGARRRTMSMYLALAGTVAGGLFSVALRARVRPRRAGGKGGGAPA